MTTLLNLGCGTVTSDRPGVINIDRSIYLRLRKHRFLAPLVPLVAVGERRQKYDSLPDNIMVHDLARGLPFADGSVDAVYHSHMLPHLDRDVALSLLQEVHRVLRPAGVQRIVLPDFELLCRDYLSHVGVCDAKPEERSGHDEYIGRIIELAVRKDAYGTRDQSPGRRFIENLILGDARRRGETTRWMYDRISLEAKLLATGFREVFVQDPTTSLIPAWTQHGLDTDAEGRPRKRRSLYIEGVK